MCRSICVIIMGVITSTGFASGGDIPQIKSKGVLRHLGVPYASFVTGSGDGLDVELVKSFAQHLGVRYEFVQTSWSNFIRDLCLPTDWQRLNLQTIRNRLFLVPAQLLRPQGRPVLSLPNSYPYSMDNSRKDPYRVLFEQSLILYSKPQNKERL